MFVYVIREQCSICELFSKSLLLLITDAVWPFRIAVTSGVLLATLHNDRVPSSEQQHNLNRSLLANFTIVTAFVC